MSQQGIPIVGPLEATINVATTATAADTTIIGGALYELVPEVDVYVNLFGTASATAGRPCVADMPYYFAANDRTAMSMIVKSAVGNVKLTRVGLTKVFK